MGAESEETCNAALDGATCVVQYFHMLPYACTCTCDVVSHFPKSLASIDMKGV